MLEMASPSSPPLGYVLKDHNRRDHTSRDSNRRRPPPHSSKSHPHSPSKPRKINPINENRLVNESSSSSKPGNHRRSCSSCHNNQEVVPSPSPLMSRRQARVLDRWATQQARETITTIERQKNGEFDDPAISDSNYVSFRSHPNSREPSPSPSDSSVSSLVQKWRELEVADIKQTPNNSRNEGGSGASSVLVSRANSAISDQENDSINAWEPSVVDNNSGGGGEVEKERLRVVDIIKKLPLVQCGEVRTICSSAAFSSPRIRGRQAVEDLFAKQERDRYNEINATSKCKAVSKFPKRCFLQTMLKLRKLRLEVSPQDQLQQQPPQVHASKKPQPENSTSSSSPINNIRESFNPTIPEFYDSVKTRHSQVDKLTTNSVMGKASSSNQSQQATKVVAKNKRDQEETCSSQFNNAGSEATHLERDQVEILGKTKAPLETNNNQEEQEKEGNMEKMDSSPSPEEEVAQHTTLLEGAKEEHTQPEMTLSSDVVLPNEAVNCVSPETNSMFPHVVWDKAGKEHMIYEEEGEEEVYDDYVLCGPYLDWINDVSKPRSHWDSLRQAWYQEMFTSSSNNEIRQLIERGSVSNVLASDFPDKMDRIMMSSSSQRQAKPLGCGDEDENILPVVFPCSQMQPLIFHQDEEQQGCQGLQEHHFVVEEPITSVEERREEPEQEVAGDKDEVENEERVEGVPESSGSHKYNDGVYYDEQAQASSPSDLPWTNYDNQEDSDKSEQSESTPHQEQSSITNSFDQETQGDSSGKNNSSIEMELIYDLRTHMEQMYSEMSELRKSVNSCVDMQAKLQSSIKDEVSSALSHSGSKKVKDKESNGKVPKKGCCCICYEKKVDSVLYRCGHMCACFKCAHELQWSSGKCPICRAQIADVVRVYTDDDV